MSTEVEVVDDDHALQRQDVLQDSGSASGEVVSKSADVDVILTTLHEAAATGNVQVLQTLVTGGTDINSTDQLGDTALHCSIDAGQLMITEFLVNNGAKLDVANSTGETALHVAARRNDQHVIGLLAAVGADLNAQDALGFTPLHSACQSQSVDAALCLLQYRPNVDIIDHAGETPLHKACRANLLLVVQVMCADAALGEDENRSVNVFNKAGQSALHLAARVGNADLVRCLVLSGADLDLVNKDGVRAEEIALGQGHIELADFMSKLNSSMVHGKRDLDVSQLSPSNRPLWRIKLKIFGDCQVGKSTLVQSLKCGYIRGLFRQLTSGSAGTNTSQDPEACIEQTENDRGCRRNRTFHENCTRCIDVNNVSVPGAGDMSFWEFSGYEQYYSIYDHFVGDPNCIHVVVFRCCDPQQTQQEQIKFWLNFIRARIAPAEPIGYAGTQLWAPRVILVATHADRVSSTRRNSRGETEFPGENSLVTSLQKEFGSELLIAPRVYTLDARQATGADIKAIKAIINELKQFLCQYLPPSIGFLDTTVNALPSWNRLLGRYPVVRWPTFVDYIRSRVHILATESHLQELICQLQLMGEVIYIESEAADLIVLNPKWLFHDVISRLFCPSDAPEMVIRRDGNMAAVDFVKSFPGMDAADMTSLLTALELCSTSMVDGMTAGYHLHCLNQLPVLEGLTSIERATRCGGLQLRAVNCGSTAQLRYVFHRVQQSLWAWDQRVQSIGGKAAARLSEWKNGTMIQFSVPPTDTVDNCNNRPQEDPDHDDIHQLVVRLSTDGRSIEVECQGRDASVLYELQSEAVSIVIKVVEACCPGLFVEQAAISAADIRQRSDRKPLRSYSPGQLASAMLRNETDVCFSDNRKGARDAEGSDDADEDNPDTIGSESLIDLVAFGSAELFDSMKPVGPDLHISHLPIYARCQLGSLLDPPHPLGRDWCLLAVSLGLSDALPQVDSSQAVALSRTDAVLAVWSHDPNATIRQLHDVFVTSLQRPDAAQSLLDLTPVVPVSSINGSSSLPRFAQSGLGQKVEVTGN